VETGKYLERIGVAAADAQPDLEGLRRLQRRHLLSVPFENLDIHWSRPIVLEAEKFFAKIVGDRRGGFCYELNGLFNELLRATGFRTRLVSARVSDGRGGFGPEFDHLAIIVTIGEREFLTDVGFGDFAAEPLALVPDIEQEDVNGVFLLRRAEYGTLEVLKKTGEGSAIEYAFGLNGRDLSEFAGMCEFHQTSPESHFTRGKLCSIMTGDGRKTLTENKFIVSRGESRIESEIDSPEQFDEILFREFQIARDS